MVDLRATLPQELAGGCRGLPCSRRRTLTKSDKWPEIYGAKLPQAQPLTGGDLRSAEQVAYLGTQNLPTGMARARSLGALQKGGAIDKALVLRQETNLGILVRVLMEAARPDKPLDIRHFRKPYNAHREQMANREYSTDQLRSKVLHTLMKYPLVDVYDLLRCDERHWSNISRELGGISHGSAVKVALEHIKEAMPPADRAAFWAAVGNRQSGVDHGRTLSFAGDGMTLSGDNAESGLRITHPHKGFGTLIGWTHRGSTFGHVSHSQTAGLPVNGLCRVVFDKGDPHGTDVDMNTLRVYMGHVL
mmetsp:Transcript_44053/g.113929  ORF Transcript_44053/g.113929 Transcript_44053/m.113929 type:complete len:304 (-) Transcript_44053:131-1042(-)